MAGGYVQVDETPVDYLCPGHGQTKQGYLWTCSRPGGDVIFEWHTSRGAACLENIIPVEFRGTLQCDAYSGYRAYAKGCAGRITLAGCWAHARRKFHEAREQSPRQAGWLLRQIGHLYRIEAQLRDLPAGPRLRDATRASESRPIHERIHKALVRLQGSKRHLPQSLMGKAISYTLNNWPMLGVYLADGRVEIDNNLVENAIRPTAIGKKNWLFFGDAEAGQRSAIIYSIIESCRRRGIDPHAYLRDVLTRLPHLTNWQIKELPANLTITTGASWTVSLTAIPKATRPEDRNLWSKKEYGNFELRLDWRIKESPFVNVKARIILPDGTYKKDESGNVIAITAPNTDSGVFLRGQHKSQVNIWCWPAGSGEVWGYRTDPAFSAKVHAGATPKVKADRPVGEWNTFRIMMQGDRLTVTLNDKLVIDDAELPGVPRQGPLALQLHADRKDGDWGASLVQFRNIRIKELNGAK